MVRRGMPSQMAVNRPTRVMVRRLLVGMGVYERSAQASGLNGHRERQGEYSPHDVLIVRDPRS